MTEQVESLILEYLRGIRADISSMKQDIRELKLRMTSLETRVGSLFGDVIRHNARLDSIDERPTRIEHRLELQPVPRDTGQNIQTSPAVIVK